MKIFTSTIFLIGMFSAMASTMGYNKGLIVYNGDDNSPFFHTRVGKCVIECLRLTNLEKANTTSCRLENKRVASEENVLTTFAQLKLDGYELNDRGTINLPPGAKAGTFTLYGQAIKFIEARNLPKTSIKMRIRFYVFELDGITKRSEGTDKTAYLELKIKNPFPEYPLSVHKYRLMMPDEDILALIRSHPHGNDFSQVIDDLALKAHLRDTDGKNGDLIDAMFWSIKRLAMAEPRFIKPNIAITYHRASKKYDEKYQIAKKKKSRKKDAIRSYEITIDENLKAFWADLSEDYHAISIDRYFANGGENKYLIASYPAHARVVEFKQPDAIGYDGPGRIRPEEKMTEAQKALWNAFVKRLVPIENSTLDHGKFFHVKQFIRLQNGQGKDGEKTLLQGLHI